MQNKVTTIRWCEMKCEHVLMKKGYAMWWPSWKEQFELTTQLAFYECLVMVSVSDALLEKTILLNFPVRGGLYRTIFSSGLRKGKVGLASHSHMCGYRYGSKK